KRSYPPAGLRRTRSKASGWTWPGCGPSRCRTRWLACAASLAKGEQSCCLRCGGAKRDLFFQRLLEEAREVVDVADGPVALVQRLPVEHALAGERLVFVR